MTFHTTSRLAGRAATGLLLACGWGVAAAADQAANKAESPPETISQEAVAAGTMALAQQVALYGQATQNALALIVAAQMAAAYAPVAGDGQVRQPDGRPDQATGEPLPNSAAEYLALASELAAGDPAIEALIAGMDAGQAKGSTLGAGALPAPMRTGWTAMRATTLTSRSSATNGRSSS